MVSKKLKHDEGEKVKDNLSIVEIEADLVKMVSIETTNKQNNQLLLLVESPNPELKWELIRQL